MPKGVRECSARHATRESAFSVFGQQWLPWLLNMIGESVKNIALNPSAMARNRVSFIKWGNLVQYHIRMKDLVMMTGVWMKLSRRDEVWTINWEKIGSSGIIADQTWSKALDDETWRPFDLRCG